MHTECEKRIDLILNMQQSQKLQSYLKLYITILWTHAFHYSQYSFSLSKNKYTWNIIVLMHRYIEFSDVKDNIFSFQRYIRSFAKIKAATL